MNSDFDSILEIFPTFSEKDRLDIIENLNKNLNSISYSHRNNGRWENQYIDLSYVNSVKTLFNIAYKTVKKYYDKSTLVPCKEFGFKKNEFWFNISTPNESTGWHDHKQNSLFSGIYYLKVPPLSGDLKFRKKNLEGWDELKIRAVEGKMVLFKSELSHSVNRNNSLSKRVSLAFNMFAFPVELGTENSDYTRNNFY